MLSLLLYFLVFLSTVAVTCIARLLGTIIQTALATYLYLFISFMFCVSTSISAVLFLKLLHFVL